MSNFVRILVYVFLEIINKFFYLRIKYIFYKLEGRFVVYDLFIGIIVFYLL